MCKLYYYVQTTCYTASVAILIVICLERYVAIIYPIHTRRLHDIRLLCSVVVGVWIIAALSGIHYLVIFDTRQVPVAAGGTVQFCVTVRNFNAHLYTIISFIMWYAGPLTVMTIVYIRISVVLWKSSSVSSSSNRGGRTTFIALQPRGVAREMAEEVGESDPGLVDGDEIQRVISRRNARRWNAVSARSSTGRISTMSTQLTDNPAMMTGRRRVIRMLVAVVATFAVCVLPYHVRVIWQTFAAPQGVDDWQLVIPPVTFVAYYLNSAVNPLLYAFLSDRFRACLADVLRGRCSQRSQTTLAMTAVTRRTLRA